MAAFALLVACNDDDATDVSKFGPERGLLVGTWTSDDSYSPGTITFREDGTFTRMVEPAGTTSEGAWALKGSRLTWNDGRQETIAVVDGTLYFDAFVRKPGKETGLSGTWSAYRADAYGYSQEVWEISGEKFEFDLHGVHNGYESNAAGHGHLVASGERFKVEFDGDDPSGMSDQGGELTLQQLGPNALHIAYDYTNANPAIQPGPAFSLEAWTKVPQ